jgi:hypothetical protein
MSSRIGPHQLIRAMTLRTGHYVLIPGSGHIPIAATRFDEAVLHLHNSRPDFRVRNVRCFGLIELCSGSPLN